MASKVKTNRPGKKGLSAEIESLILSHMDGETASMNGKSENLTGKNSKAASKIAKGSSRSKQAIANENSPHNIPLTREELIRIRGEVTDQNHFRRRVDRWWDYYDGNQLDAEVLQRLADLGVPPAIEPLCHVAIDSIIGVEVKNRTDFVALADLPGEEPDLIAKALSEKMKVIETRSGADESSSEGLKHIAVGGFGFVGIYPQEDPFKFPIQVSTNLRNEIWWDMSDQYDRTLQKAKWLLREKWVNVEDCREQLEEKLGVSLPDLGYQRFGSSMLDEESDFAGLELSGVWPEISRGYAVEEKELFDSSSNQLLITEVLYRRWAKTKLVKTKDGRVFEEGAAPKGVSLKGAKRFVAVTSRVRQAFVIGERIIYDGFSPLFRDDFHYAPFFGFIEDRTGTPYGLMKFMTYLQDEINSRTSKMQYLLSSVRTIRPDGMFIEEDDVFRDEVGRSDADLVFDPAFVEDNPNSAKLMSIEFLKDIEQEQYQRLKDAREALFAVVGITPGWLGQTSGSLESGVGYQQMIDQTNQTLVKLFDYYQIARKNLGRLLLMLGADSISENEEVRVKDAVGKQESIILNEITGDGHRTNDVQRYTYQVQLADVPTTPTFRAQQAMQLTEVAKSAPPHFQHLFYPQIFAHQQIPNASELAQQAAEIAERFAGGDIEEQIQAAIEKDRMERNHDIEVQKLSIEQEKIAIENRKLDLQELKDTAETSKIEAETDKIDVEATGQRLTNQYTPVQTAREIVMTPGVVPVADELSKSAGVEDLNAAPIFLDPGVTGTVTPAAQGVTQNPNPTFPPRPSGQQAPSPTVGQPASPDEPRIEGTPRVGIEASGSQLPSGPSDVEGSPSMLEMTSNETEPDI